MKPNYDLLHLHTPVKVEVFERLLEGYDPVEKEFICRGFSQGFQLGFQGNRRVVQQTDNLPSCRVYPEIIWEKISKEVEDGHVAGPFNERPFLHFYQSPIGLVPKAGQIGKFRLIFHLSAPEKEISVNGQIPHEDCTVTYNDFDQAVKLLQEIGMEAQIGKSDMEHAFRQVPICPADWQLLVFKAVNPQTKEVMYFVDKCLPSGSASSCQIYQRISNGLSWVVSRRTKKPNVNYLDDFLFADRGERSTNWQILIFLKTAREIGFPVSEDKTEWAKPQQVFLGLLLDAINQIIGLPIEKLEKGLKLIIHLLQHKKGTVRQLMSLAGFLNFLIRAVVHGHPFLRRVYSTYAPVCTHPGWHVSVGKELKKDLQMWRQFLEMQPLYRPFVDHLEIPATRVGLASDAAGNPNLGFGCCYKLEYLSQQWPVELFQRDNPSICWLELYALATAIVLWGEEFSNQRVAFDCDNQAVVAILNHGTSRCTWCLELLRFITGHALAFNSIYRVVYVPSKLNAKADALSRLKLDEFFQLEPTATTLGRQRQPP